MAWHDQSCKVGRATHVAGGFIAHVRNVSDIGLVHLVPPVAKELDFLKVSLAAVVVVSPLILNP